MLQMPDWDWVRRAIGFGDWLLDLVNAHAMLIKGILAFILAVYATAEIVGHQDRIAQVNLIAITGFLTGLLFLFATDGVRKRYESVLDSVVNSGVVQLFPPRPEESEKADKNASTTKGVAKAANSEKAELLTQAKLKIEGRARSWGAMLGAIIVGLTVVWFSNLGAGWGTFGEILATVTGYLLSATMGFVIGLRAARMAVYGWQGVAWRSIKIEENRAALNPQLGDPDRLCGLERVGRFYEFLAGRFMWPILYSLIWLLIFTEYEPGHVPPEMLPQLKGTMWASLGILVLLQFVGFVAPVVTLHWELKDLRQKYLEQFEEQIHEILELETKLETCAAASRAGLMAKLTFLRTRREDIWNMPKWPVRRQTLGVFSFSKSSPVLLAAAGNLLGIPSQLTEPIDKALIYADTLKFNLM